MSSQLLLNFTINNLDCSSVFVLSVFNDKIFSVRSDIKQLFIYCPVGRILSFVKINDVHDAMWTPRGNIVYTTGFKVVVMSEPDKVITSSIMNWPSRPYYLSVSNDDIIYLADYDAARVNQSTDNGAS